MNDPGRGRRIPEHEATDADLISRALACNDRAAFGVLVRRHQAALRSQLRRLCKGNVAQADDLAQEAFVLAYRKLAHFRGESGFATWLYRIGFNVFASAARRRGEMVVAEHDATGEGLIWNDQPDLVVDVRRALMDLPEAERSVLLHCYYLALTHEETAQTLGMPLGTVKTLMARGKVRLRHSLSSWASMETRGDANEPDHRPVRRLA